MFSRFSVSFLIACSTLSAAFAANDQPATPPRFTPEMEAFVKNFRGAGQDSTTHGAPPPPAESVARYVMPEGYAAQVIVSEPVVRQPLDIRFDERGRLWVVQYLQYPFPAGVTITGYDQYLRTVGVNPLVAGRIRAERLRTVGVNPLVAGRSGESLRGPMTLRPC